MKIATGLRIVGIGGTLRPRSSSGIALRLCLDHAAALGAITTAFTGPDLVAPLFEPGAARLPNSMARMIASLRAADGIILASPGYHGGISGAIKNALDYTRVGDCPPISTGGRLYRRCRRMADQARP